MSLIKKYLSPSTNIIYNFAETFGLITYGFLLFLVIDQLLFHGEALAILSPKTNQFSVTSNTSNTVQNI